MLCRRLDAPGGEEQHVRVDIDENDLYRFRERMPAWANMKGRKDPRFPLEFVRIEPYVIPKKSLTGDNSERVDTRALQVLYALPDQPPPKVYVGQQMEVFLAVGDTSESMASNQEAVAGPTPAPSSR